MKKLNYPQAGKLHRRAVRQAALLQDWQVDWDNTNWRAGGPGGLEGRVSKWKTLTFGGLHRRQKGGLRKMARRTAEKGSPPTRPFWQPSLMCSPPACFNMQPTGPFCSAACRPALLCSSPVRGKFMFFIWQHGPPARPALRLVLSVDCTLRGASGLHIKLGCGKRAVRRAALFCSSPRPFSQPAAPPFSAARRPSLLACLLCSPPTVHVFHLETWPSSTPGPPSSVIP